MKTAYWGIAVAAAFAFGIFASASPVYGPHFRTWDNPTQLVAHLSVVETKLDTLDKFYSPTPSGPSPLAGDAEITLKLATIQDELENLELRTAEWCEVITKNTDCPPPRG